MRLDSSVLNLISDYESRPMLYFRDAFRVYCRSAKRVAFRVLWCFTVVSISVCFFGNAHLNAQATNWTGANGTSYFDAGNWSVGVPGVNSLARFNLAGSHTVDFGFGSASSDEVVVSSDFLFKGSTGAVYHSSELRVFDSLKIDGFLVNTNTSLFEGNVELANSADLNSPALIRINGGGGMLIGDSLVATRKFGMSSTGFVGLGNGGRIQATTFEIGRPQTGEADSQGNVSVNGSTSEIVSTSLRIGGGGATGGNKAYLTISNGGKVKSSSAVIAVQGSDAGNESIVAVGSNSTFENTGTMTIGNSTHPGFTNLLFVEDSTVNFGSNLRQLASGHIILDQSTLSGAKYDKYGGSTTIEGNVNLTGDFNHFDGTTNITGGQVLGPRVNLTGGTIHSDVNRISTGLFILNGGEYIVDRLTFSDLSSLIGQSGKIAGTISVGAGDIFNAATNSNFTVSTNVDTSGVLIKNFGTIESDADGFGTSRLVGGLENQSAGEVRVSAGNGLRFAAPRALHRNLGRVDVVGSTSSVAELEFEGKFTNELSGLITARDAIVRFDRGLVNHGRLSTALGDSEVYGDIDNKIDGAIGVGGNSTMAILGDLVQNGDLNILAGSRAVVFGDFSGAGGTSGTGLLEVLGKTSIGNSPASVSFGGDFAVGRETLFELGGLGIGEFDQLNIAGDLMLGGDLIVEMWDGWEISALDQYSIANVDGELFGKFNLLDEGDLVGTFSGHDLFISYSGGDGNDVVLFNAVPEPGGMAVLLLGLAIASKRRRTSMV